MRYFAALSLALLTFPGISASEEIRMIAWNVESGGNDGATIASQIEAFDGYDIWALSEVRAKNQLRYARACGRNEGAFFQPILGTSGNDDRLMVAYNSTKFRVKSITELDHLKFGGGRSPLVVEFSPNGSGQDFLLVVNHLQRGSPSKRLKQARGLNEWASSQALPVISTGDFNFDVDPATAEGNAAFDAFIEGGVWRWVRPSSLMATQYSDRNNDGQNDFGSVLDLFIVAGAATQWGGESTIIVRAGDFPDDETTSDHRPVEAIFTISTDPALPDR